MSTSLQAQELSLPLLFSDHMVLQRNENIKFWGWDKPGQDVTVSLNGAEEITTSNNNGYWQVYLPAQKAGGPFKVEVVGSSEIMLSDVYIGDVWVAGGQSNMEWKFSNSVNGGDEEVAGSDYPEIRFFEIPNTLTPEPQDTLPGGAWVVAHPETSSNFSAVAWYFAKLNHTEKGVPVGIIESNWGGTPAEAWTPAEALLSVEGYIEKTEYILEEDRDWTQEFEANQAIVSKMYQQVEDTILFLESNAHSTEFDDSDWETIQIPNSEALNDFVWLRKSFELDEIANAELSFGNPGKFTVAFINGHKIYKKIWSDDPYIISIDKSLLNVGTNTIAVRTVEDWSNETFFGRENELWFKTENETINLEGDWLFSNTVETPLPTFTRFEHEPSFLYNAMIHPMLGYSIKGVIWYQGESNVGSFWLYRELFSQMITAWRDNWGQGDFPFLFVQLANFLQRSEEPQNSYWAGLREAQTQTLDLPNTGMATIIDIGEAEDVHPRNKKDVGYRLWQAAKHVAFNEMVVYSGPTYRSHTVDNNMVEITFDFAENGWQNKNFEHIEGFAVAGEDSVFHWANAEIDKNMIRIWSDEVQNPIAIRYAWADNPKVSLYNREGLPVVPFRTDDWKQ